jgi:large subunit ribosomal protein L23
VRTANYDGKARQERRATRGGSGRTNHWKKAIVRLKEGEKLDLA